MASTSTTGGQQAGRLPLWAVKELQVYYQANGIMASDEQVCEDLAKLVELFKLVLRHTPVDEPETPMAAKGEDRNASSASKTTYYPEVCHVSHD